MPIFMVMDPKPKKSRVKPCKTQLTLIFNKNWSMFDTDEVVAKYGDLPF